MLDETRKAIEESIVKWKKKASEENPMNIKISTSECPLCQLFNNDYTEEGNECLSCPIFEETGYDYCEATPCDKATLHLHDWRFSQSKEEIETYKQEFREAAKKEIEFLKSLLPNKEKDQ